MIRFSAGVEEIAGLLHFLRKRAPKAHLTMSPLPQPSASRPPRQRDFRLRRTARPFLNQIISDLSPAYWAIFTELDDVPRDPHTRETTGLIFLQMGPADPTGRREGLLEARDEMIGEPPYLTPRALVARNLVERCARRVRRRGIAEKGRWVLPD